MSEDEFKKSVGRMASEVLAAMGYDGTVEIRGPEPGSKDDFVCSISVPRSESKVLIGAHGANLAALQHILQLIAKRNYDEYRPFSIDINRYWKEKVSLLERDASEAARQAVATGRPVSMRPMTAAERKIIHTALANNEHIETESAGVGENRKVIVRPASII